MLQQKAMDKLALPMSSSPQKSEPYSQRKIDDEASKWKSKSLNSLPTQHYEMDIRKTTTVKSLPMTKQTKKSKQAAQQSKGKKPAEGGQKILPQPKIKKINQKMFCITIDNLLKVFYNRIRQKTANDKNTFDFLNYELQSNIEFIGQNGSEYIFVGTQNELVILKLKRIQDKYFIEEKTRKQIPKLKAVTFMAENMIAVSSEQVYQFSLSQSFELQAKKAIQFVSESDKSLFNELKTIQLVVESQCSFYFFGTKMENKIYHNNKKKFSSQNQRAEKMCEVLHIVKFAIEHNMDSNFEMLRSREEITLQPQIKKSRYMSQTQIAQSKIASVNIEIFPIDHVFEVGIFDKSKIYELDEDIFLMSLHEEIILIKKHFKKFIVWDNVSIVSSKSQEKKGQLILADKRVLVYSENGEIFAHDIYFNEDESRINMPPIDSFRGNDNDEEILYDAVLLQYDKDSLMKVLFYFKEIDVILPNKSKFRKEPDNPNEQQHDENKLSFTMLCINQSDPLEKLKQMLKQKKPPNQISEFCERFNIKPLQKTKAMWSVSEKSLKDIENVLLQISDDSYIQTQLDNILKKQPHNLTFLISVEKKQIARLKKLIVRNLLNDSGTSQVQIMSEAGDPSQTESKRRDYVKKVIQWLMESLMFQKKLDYSKNFLSFKEYDFIEIGKLKAASLKEQIKLLSCKKYEKRLKYFLNSFRVLAIANWEEIFEFLLQNKNQTEIQQFILDFSFILPKFVETSSVFQAKKQGIRKPDESQRNKELALRDDSREGRVNADDEKCKLWDDLPEVQSMIDEAVVVLVETKENQAAEQSERQLNTIEDFQTMIVKNIKDLKRDPRTQAEACNNFKQILYEVTRSKWFEVAAFKQHSMLNRTSKQLQDEFLELKNKKAYQILVKYLYKEIEKGNPQITEDGVKNMLRDFVEVYHLVPQSFKKNDDVRLSVYEILIRVRLPNKAHFTMKKSQFLVMNQDVYFHLLFTQMRSQLLKTIKNIYEKTQIGFFRQRFQTFLKSKLVDIQSIIAFLDEFQNSSENDQRRDVFNCIIRLLKLNDYPNTEEFIKKSLNKEVLDSKSHQIGNDSEEINLRQQAKIPYGFVFFYFFKAFNLSYTYEELIAATQNANLASNNLLKQLIHKYCVSDYQKDTNYDGNKQCIIFFQNSPIVTEKLTDVDIYNRPLEFFGILLFMVETLEFQVEQKDLYELMIQNYLNQGKAMEEKTYNEFQSTDSPRTQMSPPPMLMHKAHNIVYQNKFEQLRVFVQSIDKYEMRDHVINTKNYIYIQNFIESHDPEQIFVDYTINWINRKYTEIKSKEQIEPTLIAVKKVLDILQKSNKSTRSIKQVDAFYRLLQFLKKFNNDMMMKIDFIKKQQEEHSGFIFLIHMFREIGVDNFISLELRDDKYRGEHRKDNTLMDAEKKDSESIQTLTKINNFECIYSQYKIMRGEENVQDNNNPEFIRFIIQICCIMITEQKYEIAWDLLLRAVNQSYYFKDAFYYLASCMRIQNKEDFKRSLKAFHQVQTKRSLQQCLKNMLNGAKKSQDNPGKVLNFPPQRLIKSGEKSEYQNSPQTKKHNAIFIFQQLFKASRPDEGFFYLVRIKRIHNNEIQRFCQSSQKLSPLGLKSYLLLTAYMKCLQKYISNQFYPTFLFFKSKYEILIDNVERKDIIKDINIAISRLKSRIEEETSQALKKDIIESKKELYHYYEQYMIFVGEPVIIRLTQEDEEQATKRIQMYARIINPNQVEEGNKEEYNAKLKLQQNQEKLQRVHENNKLNVIHKEIQESVTEAKRTADKYANILEEKKKETSRMTLAQRKEQELMEIRRKENDDISSIKDSFKSNTTQKVNQLIEQLKLKRQKIAESRYKSSMIGDEHVVIPQKDIPSMKKIQAKDLPQSKYNVQVNTMNKPGLLMTPQNYVGGRVSQIIQNAKKSVLIQNAKKSFIQGQSKQEDKFTDIQQKIKRYEQPLTNKAKVTIDQITEIFKAKQPQALKYLQKFDLIKQNMNVAVQLIKRVYSVIKDLANFLQFMRYLFGYDERYREVLEEKAIAIVGQMIKMDQKINLKELIPVELFIQLHNGMTLKDYYNFAYETMKPNLKKILAQQKIAAHALGILMRYSLGSQTKYFHRVFADYIAVLLKNYQTKIYDEKQVFLLAEKLRSQFTNLEPEDREYLFEKLIGEVTNQAKRKKLIENLKKALQRKTDSAIGGGQIQEITRAVLRLEKK